MVSVFLKDGYVRAIEGSLKRGALKVSRAYRSLDAVPQKGPFLLVADPPVSLHRIFTTPPVSRRALKRLLALELSRLEEAPKDFVFSFRRIGEAVLEGRRRLEALVCALERGFVDELSSKLPWLFRGIKGLYTVELSVMGLVRAVGGGERVVVAFLPGEVFVVVTDGSRIRFSRKLTAPEDFPVDALVGQINETLIYIPRVTGGVVEKVWVVGEGSVEGISYPVESLAPPEGVEEELFREFFLPIGAFFVPKELSLLPEDYKTRLFLDTLYGYYLRLAAFLVAGLCALNFSFFLELKGVKAKNEALRKEVEGYIPLFREVKSLKREVDGKKELISLVSRSRESFELMNDLSFLLELGVKGVKLEKVRVSGRGVEISCSFECPEGDRYGALEAFISGLGERFSVKSVYLSDKGFRVEAHR